MADQGTARRFNTSPPRSIAVPYKQAARFAQLTPKAPNAISGQGVRFAQSITPRYSHAPAWAYSRHPDSYSDRALYFRRVAVRLTPTYQALAAGTVRLKVTAAAGVITSTTHHGSGTAALRLALAGTGTVATSIAAPARRVVLSGGRIEGVRRRGITGSGVLRLSGTARASRYFPTAVHATFALSGLGAGRIGLYYPATGVGALDLSATHPALLPLTLAQGAGGLTLSTANPGAPLLGGVGQGAATVSLDVQGDASASLHGQAAGTIRLTRTAGGQRARPAQAAKGIKFTGSATAIVGMATATGTAKLTLSATRPLLTATRAGQGLLVGTCVLRATPVLTRAATGVAGITLRARHRDGVYAAAQLRLTGSATARQKVKTQAALARIRLQVISAYGRRMGEPSGDLRINFTVVGRPPILHGAGALSFGLSANSEAKISGATFDAHIQFWPTATAHLIHPAQGVASFTLDGQAEGTYGHSAHAAPTINLLGDVEAGAGPGLTLQAHLNLVGVGRGARVFPAGWQPPAQIKIKVKSNAPQIWRTVVASKSARLDFTIRRNDARRGASGASQSSIVLSVAGSAAAGSSGRGAAGIKLSGTAHATRIRFGARAAKIALTSSATARRTAIAAGALLLNLGAAAAGQRGRSGAGAVGIGWSCSGAAGSGPPGQGAAGITLTATASPTRIHSVSGAGALALAAGGSMRRTAAASAHADLTLGLSEAGCPGASDTPHGELNLDAEAQADTGPGLTAVGELTLEAQGQATRIQAGQGHCSITVVGQGTAARRRDAAAHAALTLSATADGISGVTDTPYGFLALTAVAEGQGGPAARATGSITWQASGNARSKSGLSWDAKLSLRGHAAGLRTTYSSAAPRHLTVDAEAEGQSGYSLDAQAALAIAVSVPAPLRTAKPRAQGRLLFSGTAKATASRSITAHRTITLRSTSLLRQRHISTGPPQRIELFAPPPRVDLPYLLSAQPRLTFGRYAAGVRRQHGRAAVDLRLSAVAPGVRRQYVTADTVLGVHAIAWVKPLEWWELPADVGAGVGMMTGRAEPSPVSDEQTQLLLTYTRGR